MLPPQFALLSQNYVQQAAELQHYVQRYFVIECFLCMHILALGENV